MTDRPSAAATSPARVELETGRTYFWCRCGRSNAQPFCDGSHKGTGISPLRFTVEKTNAAWLCQCKSTGDPPYCDGSHKGLAESGEP